MIFGMENGFFVNINVTFVLLLNSKTKYVLISPREGVIIKCYLNELFHDFVTIIITSKMAVSKILLMVAVSKNVRTFIIFFIK